ncbi:MAG: TlpA disulfide reductase family protein [Rikenellaceae bacterium]
MKRFILSLVATIATLGSLSAQSLPNTKVQNVDGRVIETQGWIDHKTPFIVSFWSTTCKPCIKELDTMSEYYEDWNDECPFRVIAVSIDDSRSVARAKALARGRGWGDFFTLAYDVNSDFKRALNVVSVPQVFVFDKNGNIVYSHTGYTPGNEVELFEKIKTLK